LVSAPWTRTPVACKWWQMPPATPMLLGMPISRHACCSVRLSFLIWGVCAFASTAPWRGISYGVSPDEDKIANDDMFNEPSRPQWGCPGRGDLTLMAQMGANVVRLYGNDPNFTHDSFLDEAESLGLGVIPGISDWPYIQGQDYCSLWSDSVDEMSWYHGLAGKQLHDCHNRIKESYLGNLINGFMVNDTYHPGMRAMIAVNEPELKLGNTPKHWAKAVISALDGMLSAEEEAGLTSPELPITVTVSFMVCSHCEKFSNKPALGQMWTLRDAMRQPHKYNYKPKHNLSAFYDERFINSFNTGNPAFEIEDLFLNDYSNSPDGFAGTPVFIAEYHSPSEPVSRDLATILSITNKSKELLGISFFEWINRHDEGGHTDWGIFNLKVPIITRMINNGTWYNIRSLVPSKDQHGNSIALSIAEAYGGSYSQGLMCESSGMQNSVLLP